MAKLLVVKDDDPGVAVIFEHVRPGTTGKAQGWHGTCTECGPDWAMHRWHWENALSSAQRHVSNH